MYDKVQNYLSKKLILLHFVSLQNYLYNNLPELYTPLQLTNMLSFNRNPHAFVTYSDTYTYRYIYNIYLKREKLYIS